MAATSALHVLCGSCRAICCHHCHIVAFVVRTHLLNPVFFFFIFLFCNTHAHIYVIVVTGLEV